MPNIFLGTSSFTAAGWEGSFYSLGMRSKDFLRHYSSQFQTVEIDSVFYGTPAASTVTSWNERTPQDFIFAVKVPQVITHEKVLVDCEPEFDEFMLGAARSEGWWCLIISDVWTTTTTIVSARFTDEKKRRCAFKRSLDLYSDNV